MVWQACLLEFVALIIVCGLICKAQFSWWVIKIRWSNSVYNLDYTDVLWMFHFELKITLIKQKFYSVIFNLTKLLKFLLYQTSLLIWHRIYLLYCGIGDHGSQSLCLLWAVCRWSAQEWRDLLQRLCPKYSTLTSKASLQHVTELRWSLHTREYEIFRVIFCHWLSDPSQ